MAIFSLEASAVVATHALHVTCTDLIWGSLAELLFLLFKKEW